MSVLKRVCYWLLGTVLFNFGRKLERKISTYYCSLGICFDSKVLNCLVELLFPHQESNCFGSTSGFWNVCAVNDSSSKSWIAVDQVRHRH